MFDALVNGRIDCGELTFEVAYYDIEELNRRAEAGEADVSKISYALLPGIQSRYTLRDRGSGLGRGNGPVFVTRQGTPPDSIRRVAVPGLHTTANALMSRLYPSITQKEPVLFSEIAPTVARGEYDAGVLIHEGRFVYRKLGLELIADLGELWESRTGLPLPLGAIVARRTLPEELRCEIERLLRTSIEYAFAHREESRTYIKEHARELDDRVIDHHMGPCLIQKLFGTKSPTDTDSFNFCIVSGVHIHIRISDVNTLLPCDARAFQNGKHCRRIRLSRNPFLLSLHGIKEMISEKGSYHIPCLAVRFIGKNCQKDPFFL